MKWEYFHYICIYFWASLVAQMVKNLPVMTNTQVWSLGQEDPLEKEMETHSSNLAWRMPWIEEPGGLQCMGLQRVGHNWATFPFMFNLGEDSFYYFRWESQGPQRLSDLPNYMEPGFLTWESLLFLFLRNIFLFVAGLGWIIWYLVPWPGIEPGLLHWEHRVSATGPLLKSPYSFWNYFTLIFLPPFPSSSLSLYLHLFLHFLFLSLLSCYSKCYTFAYKSRQKSLTSSHVLFWVSLMAQW